MRRKRTSKGRSGTESSLFIWDDRRLKRSKNDESDVKEVEFRCGGTGTQLELILKEAPSFSDSVPLPYEMLMKIFNYVISSSDHPLRDLCNLARVCEVWRQIVLESPTLWSRIDLTKIPATDRNLSVLDKVFKTNPSIRSAVKEVSICGSLETKNKTTISFIEALLTSPNMTTFAVRDYRTQSRSFAASLLVKSISQCKRLRSLNVTDSRILFTNQKWLADHLVENGKHLESLNLAMSLTTISSQLFRACASEFCPNLQVLDISTCDTLTTHSFDAIQLAQNMPKLKVLRVGNVSFKRVYNPPEVFGLTQLMELSMPIGMRDADRDDALFATLTFGSANIYTLDLRGSSITAKALLDMPSFNVREFHMDDLCPITRKDYHKVIRKWSDTLEVLSLVKINCSETVKSCLEALYDHQAELPRIRDLDLSSSDVTTEDLKKFLRATHSSLKLINLSSCRSLPRGCKGVYSKEPKDRSSQKLSLLDKKLN